MSGRRRAVALAAVALAAPGCGGDDPEDVLRETADKLGDIRSGRLSMTMAIDARGAGARGGAVGFALRGPFALPEGGGLPRARVAYTQVADTRRATVTLTSNGRAAFVKANGRTIRLSAEQTRRLRAGARRLGGNGAGSSLRIGSWVREPKLSDGGTVGGAETDRVSAELDVAAAARDLLAITQALGPEEGARAFEGASGKELQRAVKRSSFELYTGKDDRLLRRLAIAVDLAAERVPRARIRFELGVAAPNEPVRIGAG